MSLPNLENKKVLVVEDDEMSYLYLSQLLKLAHSNFVREKTGIDAIQEFRNHPDYDLILMDIQLPDMDGKQVTAEIRKINPQIPIIAQTASKSAAEHDLMIDAGCSEVLTKPFSMDQLFYTLIKVLVC